MRTQFVLGVAVGAIALAAVVVAPASAASSTTDSSPAAERAAAVKISRQYASKMAECQKRGNRKSRNKCATRVRGEKSRALIRNRRRFADLRSRNKTTTPGARTDRPGPETSCQRYTNRYSVGEGSIQLRLKSAVVQALADSGSVIFATGDIAYDSGTGVINLGVRTAPANFADWSMATDACDVRPIEGWTGEASIAVNGQLAVQHGGSAETIFNNPTLSTSSTSARIISTGATDPAIRSCCLESSAQTWGVVQSPNEPNPSFSVSLGSVEEVAFSDSARASLGIATPAVPGSGDAQLYGSLPLTFLSRTYR